MTEAQQFHDKLLTLLREKQFDRLVIKQLGPTYYLVIFACDRAHVFSDRKGRKMKYSHAWKIHDWLNESFGIPRDSVLVETIQV